MFRLATRALSLAAAVAMTSGATAALTTYGMWGLPPDKGCTLGPPLIFADVEPGRPLPPPLPRFIQPRLARVKAPNIVCEVPGDPAAVTDCSARERTE